MADTPRTIAALLALAPDNTQGLISPQDLRDMLVSLYPSRGALNLTASAATTISSANVWYKVAGTTALDLTLSVDHVDMPSNATLRTTKAVAQDVLATATVAVQTTENNNDISLTLAKNGTAINRIAISASIPKTTAPYSFVVSAIIPMAQNDTLEVQVKNLTGAHNITVVTLDFNLIGFIV